MFFLIDDSKNIEDEQQPMKNNTFKKRDWDSNWRLNPKTNKFCRFWFKKTKSTTIKRRHIYYKG